MHLTIHVQVLSYTEFRCLFLLILNRENHLVPPRFLLIFLNTLAN